MSNLIKTIMAEYSNYSLNDYYEALSKLRSENDKIRSRLKIAILRSFSAEMIEPLLSVHLMLLGFDADFFFCDYNQYAQEILDTNSALYQFEPDLILLLVRHEELIPEYSLNFSAHTTEEWIRKIDAAALHYKHLIQTLVKQSHANILVQNFSFISRPSLGIYNEQNVNNQTALLNHINIELRRVAENTPTVYVWGFDQFIIEHGWRQLYDAKLDFYVHNPFHSKAYILMAQDLTRYIGSILGQQKKCIVLDLDNTLWGGIVGETGFSGIQLEYEYPGNCFLFFQQKLLDLTNRGIILAINSKNNDSDVNEVFEKHPHIVIKKRHIAAERINWQDKATNMRELANELNIGLDSFVFMDDSPAECELIRRELPEVTVLMVPKKPYLIPQLLESLTSELENIRITNEDMQKNSIYKAQSERIKCEKSAIDLDGFLKSLQMSIEILPCDTFSISRISQLTQKTNQFNLRTHRYTEADITQMMRSSSSHVFYVSAKDKFGEHGTVGIFILKLENEKCFIDTLLLSCRVISRTIEQSMLAFIEDFSIRNGCALIIGEYIPTPKNKQVETFYKKYGFMEEEIHQFYLILTSQKTINYSPYITLKSEV